MAYAILRIQKTKKHSVASKNRHNMRLRETANADENRKQDNQILVGCGNLKVDLKKRIDETEATVRNKETVVLQELVLTASRDYFLDSKNEFDKEKIDLWTKKQEEYLQEKFGENCVNAVLHLDEETPHIHAFITPIVYNEKKNKNEFNNKNYFLSDYKKAQDDYFKFNKNIGLDRGKEAAITNERNLPLREYNRENARVNNDIEKKIEENKQQNKLPKIKHQTERKFLVEVDKKYSTEEVNDLLRHNHSKLVALNTELVKQAEMTKKENAQLKRKLQLSEEKNKENNQTIRSVMNNNKEASNQLKYIMKLQPKWMDVLKSKEYLDFKHQQNNMKRPEHPKPKSISEINIENEKRERPKAPVSSIKKSQDLKKTIEEDQKKTSQYRDGFKPPKL